MNKRRLRLAVVFALATAAALSACANLRPSGGSTAPPSRAVYGSPLAKVPPAPSPTPEPVPEPLDGTLVITLLDQSGGHPEGIQVLVRGSLSRTLQSDENGEIRLVGPAGRYDFKVVEGCDDSLRVDFGGTGRGGIAADQVGFGTLAVTWRHRFAPGGRIAFSPDATRNWAVGQIIDVSFDVLDRCAGAVSPGASYPTFNFEPSSNLEVVGDPLRRANKEGRGHVEVRCIGGSSVARLFAVDSKNSKDRAELLTAQSGPAPACFPSS